MTRRGDDRGFALLIVLWALVLLALVFTQMVSAGRGEAERAADLRGSAAAEADADAAFYQAVFHLLDPSTSRWRPDGEEHALRLPTARASVRIVDLAGYVNPNTASAALLGALMAELGADRTTAGTAAAAMVDWRSADAQGRFGPARYAAAGLPYAPAGSAFQSIDEVGLVFGMTPQLLALMAPHLSLFNPDSPSAALADPVVLRAMTDIGLTAKAPAQATPRNVVITAAATDQSGARSVRRAVVRLGSTTPFETLSWESPPWP